MIELFDVTPVRIPGRNNSAKQAGYDNRQNREKFKACAEGNMAGRACKSNQRHDHGAGADGNFQVIAQNHGKNAQHQNTAAAPHKAAFNADKKAKNHCQQGFFVFYGALSRDSFLCSSGYGLKYESESEKDI